MALRHTVDMQNSGRPPQHIDLTANVSPNPILYAYPLLLTEDELVDLLRIPEVSSAIDL